MFEGKILGFDMCVLNWRQGCLMRNFIYIKGDRNMTKRRERGKSYCKT